ncbi:ATP-dependent Clp protease ATP-binding subunit [Phototrophicus methaneseepsis]|uniref:ATP-dependent Clp protease ATP-binding subunit n=1 Tax=Phototrophicus methaneseepsis TaxID=2710758 RepID=A0A7S8E8B3_9CHLR|nr:ATP-dependent Clp protease ATP-binding subunit [Phototrophicus methaneseepsis]QPC82224.1 ATP-dependent Clp protease ATP-binding subunit [Phototrophicus methaneseepsis]
MTPSPDIPEIEIRERCATLLSTATEEARRLGHNFVGTEHLFIAATRTEDGPTCRLLRRANLSPRHVRNEIRREVGTSDDPIGEVLPMTPRTEIVLSLAIFLAQQEDQHDVSELHMLMALLQEGEGVPVRKLIDLGFDLNFWLQKLILDQQEKIPYDLPAQEEMPWDDDSDFNLSFSDDDLLSPRSPLDSDPDMLPTPLLNRYGRDLTAQAAEGKIGPAYARDKEIRALARTLARSKKNNPLLLGDAGVGKTAIVEGLAFAIFDKTAPMPMQDYRIVQIEIGTLVAGTSLRGQFEERLIGIVEEIKRAQNIILFIDEIHTIVGAGDTIDSNLDAANILKPALARGEIKCIGATTHEEYRRAIAQDPALARRFRTIDVEEPTEADAVVILDAQRKRLEQHHDVRISQDALEAAVKMSVRYLADRRLPDKALDLLDEACTRVTIQTIHPDLLDGEDNRRDVRVADIAAVLSEWTGIPATELTTDDKRRLANLEDALKERVIGQDRAVRMVAEAIKTARAGLNDPNRPIGVFLFLGTSGVGKTELARALADFMFGSEDAMLRLDMSEFHDSHTVARLIGSPPGYKESNQGGQLTDGLRRRPYSVVLLDEIEKAAPEVFDIFLQIFDEGRLSDAHGRRVDARHSVFIMTSNIGTQESSKVLGFGGHQPDETPNFQPFLKQRFRVEFLNRIDEVVTFNMLSRDVLSRILDVQMVELEERLKHQHLKLSMTEEARQFILDESYDPVNGARPLRRTIERLLTRPLSNKIVENNLEPGATIVIALNGDQLEFRERATTDG